MTDRTGTSGDPGPDQAEPEEAKGVELRQVSEDELREILRAHKAWLRSGRREGQHADFQGCLAKIGGLCQRPLEHDTAGVYGH